VARGIEISAETVEPLKTHKAAEAELKMRNRQQSHDLGLMFAKQSGELSRKHDVLGEPPQANNLGQREFEKLIKASGVRRIKFHGLRHTCATLLLQQGTPPNVVQKRLGHKRIEMTLGIYGHALPSMQRGAADQIGALLHG
jgi:integrase